MAGASQEYVVRAPNENSKRFNVMRFANSLSVDVTKWKVARMERERSIKQSDKAATEEAPKFGFGSEYGKDAKEEARRRRYGQYARKNDDSPWTLRVGGKNGKKFKGTREGGVTENTSYYVFFQAHDGAFEAFPVSEWYNFTAIPRYKPLTSEEAEEKFEERHKIYNHFAVMASRKNTEGGEADQTETKLLKNMKKKKDFKVSDMDDWVDSDRSFDGDSDEDGEDGDSKKNGKVKGKGGNKKKGGKKKKKGSDDDDDDSEPGEESDEGDHEAREVDYMSDSSSEEEEEDLEEKLNKELKGVEDEDALRKLVLSDDDDDDEEEEGKAKEDVKGTNKGDSEDAPKGNEVDGKVKQEKSSDSDTSASDDSDDSDLDDSKFTSAMFLARKTGSASKNKNGSDQKASSSRSTTPAADQSGQSSNNSSNNNNSTGDRGNSGGGNSEMDSKSTVKRKLPSAENSPVISKKPKTNDSSAGGEAISEDAVRRYLMRKPMTAAELLQKFKGRKVPLKGQDLVQTIAHILKKLNPDKQTIKGKLHLYIKPPTGP